MSETELRQKLNVLRAEFAQSKLSDVQARNELAGLIDRIEHRLDRTDDSRRRTDESSSVDSESISADHAGLLESIQDSVRRFEAEHPSLTASLNQIFSGLSSMGL